jgi:hypothetical protein
MQWILFTVPAARRRVARFPYATGLIALRRSPPDFVASQNSNFVKLICWIEIKRYTHRKEYGFKQSSA